MDFLKIIRFFYTVYTVYIILVINTTSLKFMDILPAVLLMWILYFFFSLGYRLTKVTSINVTLTAGYKSWILNKKS